MRYYRIVTLLVVATMFLGFRSGPEIDMKPDIASTNGTIQTHAGDGVKTACVFREHYIPANFREEWGYPLVGSPQGSGVLVAILDTGIDINEPRTRKVKGQINLEDLGSAPEVLERGITPKYTAADKYMGGCTHEQVRGHGKWIAEVINQMAPQAEILSIQTCDDQGHCEDKHLLAGLEQAVKVAGSTNRLVVNISVGNLNPDQEYGPKLFDKIKALAGEGVIFVAAAGNNLDGLVTEDCVPRYPGAYDNKINGLIGVASVDNSKEKGFVPDKQSRKGVGTLRTSSPPTYNDDCTDVAFSKQLSESEPFSYGTANGLVSFSGKVFGGTSFSTAQVSGAMALLRSANRSLSAAELEVCLREHATSEGRFVLRSLACPP